MCIQVLRVKLLFSVFILLSGCSGEQFRPILEENGCPVQAGKVLQVERNLKANGIDLKALVLGSIEYKSVPKEVFDTSTQSISEMTNIETLVCLAVKRGETKPEDAQKLREYFNGQLKQSRESNVPDELTGIVVFDSKNPQVKSGTFGDCPDGKCYIVELGEVTNFSPDTKGQVLILRGNGFFKKIGKEDWYKLLFKASAGGSAGLRITHWDNSTEYLWPHSSKGMEKPGDVKDHALAFWLPLLNNSRVSTVSAEQDVSIEVVDHSINRLRVKVSISRGTLCTNPEFQTNPANRGMISQECGGNR